MQIIKKALIVLTPRNFLLKTRLSNGTLIYGINKAGYGGRGIYIYGDNYEPELNKLEYFLSQGDVFIDVGANSGVYTLKAASIVKDTGIVIAIEPFIEILNVLLYSIKANNFKNIRVRNFCAAGKTSERTLWINGELPNSSSMNIKNGTPESFSVLGVTLDDMMMWENLEKINYIKIDAEGAENEILNGAKNIINKFRPIIQTEEIVSPIDFEFENYSVFKAPNSFNIVMIPNESDKINLPPKFGWELKK